MKSINQMVLLTVIIGLVTGLISSPISVKPIFAEPPDPGFGGGDCYSAWGGDWLTCCWTETDPNDPEGIEIHKCQDCIIEEPQPICGHPYPGFYKDPKGPGIIAPPPPGVAPPPPPGPGQGGPGNVLPGGPSEGLKTAPQTGGPQVDCTQNPKDPSCNTAIIPQGEIDNQKQGRLIGPSPTGYCVPIKTPTCIPCDPGLPGNTCMPGSQWPPVRTADTDTSTSKETNPQVQEDTSSKEQTGTIQGGDNEEQQQGGGDDTAKIPEGEIEQPQQDEDQSSEGNNDNG